MKSAQKAIIITGPSGAGKSTIANHLLQDTTHFAYSISATTRKPRQGEQEGVDYYYLSETDFQQQLAKDAFVEWEQVYNGIYYGTLKKEVERIWAQNKCVVFVVDVVGAKGLKAYFKEHALSLFVQAPSLDILRERLIARQTEDMSNIDMRIAKASEEMEATKAFDLLITNDHLSEALKATERAIQGFLAI